MTAAETKKLDAPPATPDPETEAPAAPAQAAPQFMAITPETLAVAMRDAAYRPPAQRVAGMDEAQPGHYFVVAGQKVDAEGNPIK